jgi:hypothetical protein
MNEILSGAKRVNIRFILNSEWKIAVPTKIRAVISCDAIYC